jgi:hypothetical protein
MSAASRRRPLPALAFLLVLSVLTAIVWWRVLHRPDDTTQSSTPTVVQPVKCTPGRKPTLPAPASVTVVVLNGAGREGLASTVSGQLKTRGFAVGKPDNAPALASTGEIRYGAAGRTGATLLSYYLPGAKLVAGSRPDARIDLVLGSKFSALATPAAVTRAEAAAKKSC